MMKGFVRMIAAVAAAWCAAGADASADCVQTPGWNPLPAPQVLRSASAGPEDETADVIDAAAGPTRDDRRGRVVAPIHVNGDGPFNFIVDTGANRSALSSRLASRLGLDTHGIGDVHSLAGVSEAPLVAVDTVRYGDLSLPSGAMPVLGDRVLAGEHGLLGVDGMSGRQLFMDFERRCIEISRSRMRDRRAAGWTSVRGTLRFGHLLVLRGNVGRVSVNVLLDTGSDASMANVALQQALTQRPRGTPVDRPTVAYTASGDPVALQYVLLLRELNLGNLRANDVVAYVGDFHIFDVWGLREEPTLLIGMDVLSQAGAIAIDYGARRVYFRERGHARATLTGVRRVVE